MILYVYFRVLLRLSRTCAWLLRRRRKNTQETLDALWPFRIALWNLHRYGFVFHAEGARFVYSMKDLMNLKLALVGSHEYEITNFLRCHLCPSDTVVDVGANIGYYTLLAARLCPQGKVIAIEPSGINAAMLERNAQLNPTACVTIVHKAAWRKSGEHLALRVRDPHNLGANSLLDEGPVESYVVTISVDDLLEELQITGADVVMVDVEGAEYNVLLGMQKCLQGRSPRYIICALDHPDETDRRRSYELIRSAGYTEVDFSTESAITRNAIPQANMLFGRGR
jgi:FkbM family methyltransferase